MLFSTSNDFLNTIADAEDHLRHQLMSRALSWSRWGCSWTGSGGCSWLLLCSFLALIDIVMMTAPADGRNCSGRALMAVPYFC